MAEVKPVVCQFPQRGLTVLVKCTRFSPPCHIHIISPHSQTNQARARNRYYESVLTDRTYRASQYQLVKVNINIIFVSSLPYIFNLLPLLGPLSRNLIK